MQAAGNPPPKGVPRHDVHTAGRNDPCPCGSGKKYKRCCLPKDAAPSPAKRWHDLDGRMVGQIGRFARRRFAETFDERASGYAKILDDEPIMASIVVPFVAYELTFDGKPAVDWFLEERGSYLMPEERQWLKAQQRSWLSVWEVTSVEPGIRVDVKDLLTGETSSVTEMSGSKTLHPHLAILARVVDVDGLNLFCGTHPHPLPPADTARLVARLRPALGESKLVPPVRLREAAEPIFEAWDEALEEIENRPMPRLKNTDGHDIVMVTTRFRCAGPTARAEIEARLRSEPDVLAPEEGEKKAMFTFIREGNAMHRTWENTTIGHVDLLARELRLETNSLERADMLRERLASLLGGLIRFANQKVKDMETLMSERPRSGGRSSELAGPEAAALLREFKERHYASWPDEAIPALGGLSPREAAQSPSHRAELVLLLKEMEEQESREEVERRFDFARIRRELGI